MNFDDSYFTAVDMHFQVPSPGSPPGMTSSKSSKTSSLHSFSSDESVLADVGHFEEIGLDDDAATIDSAYSRDLSQTKRAANPYSTSFASDLRAQVHAHAAKPVSRAHTQPYTPTRDLAHPRAQHDVAGISKSNRAKLAGGLTTQFRGTSISDLTSLGPKRRASASPLGPRGLAVRSSSSASADRRRRRSPSPNHPLGSLNPQEPTLSTKPGRSSWQSGRERKSILELERECDEDEDDNIPDDFILDNVPLSPRPPSERTASRSSSATPATSPSPERIPKDRVRSIGNGTPPVAAAHGSLRSPSWKSGAPPAASEKSPATCPSPMKTRAKSWTAAVSTLSPETRALTEKLEDYADELDKNGTVRGSMTRPVIKPRVKSALAELPPLRRTNIMIDPLPISKEKEAVLSRTRPSWLPPKDPAEEKRHLKEYQKMMANSIEAEKRREAARQEKEKMKDAMAETLLHTWEKVLRRWDDAMTERQTRDLWWKGIAPRCRGRVWAKAVGNELELTEMSFQAALARAHEVEARIAQGKASIEDERRAVWLDRIKHDVREKTWVALNIFQPGGPLHQQLVDVLYAYSMYRSDIGYVSGSNAVAALLLLNEPSASSTFITLANVLNRALPLSFYVEDDGAKASAYNLMLATLAKKAPQLHQHLTNPDLALIPDMYLADVFTALFTRHLSLDEAARLWDVYVFEGDSLLIRAAVALLVQKEGSLLVSKTVEEVKRALVSTSRRRDSDVREDEWMKKVKEAGKV